MNKVILMGRLGGQVETRNVGEHVLGQFKLATSKRVRGESQTQWHSVKVWNKTAEKCMKFIGKGSKVLVEGEIEYSQSEKDGVKKYYTNINAQKVTFLDEKKTGQSDDMSFSSNEKLPF